MILRRNDENYDPIEAAESFQNVTQDEIDAMRLVGAIREQAKEIPKLKTYHKLTKEDVEGLEIISDDDFSDIVDSIILNDYRSIPNAVRLPNLKAELAEKLGLEKKCCVYS
ncbi:MAG: hypothetical protein J6Y60_05820 [Treponema sp.]|nr:hypothetical protein [Treponema sp.]